MSFIKKLPKLFVQSAVRQVGRDGGKVISNKVYKGQHGTPIYNSGSQTEGVVLESKNISVSDIDMSIQPEVKGGNLSVIIIGFLLNFIPLIGTIIVLVKSVFYLNNKTANVYVELPNKINDNRHKEGYRIEGSSIIETNQKRILSLNEITRQKTRGLYYLLSFLLFLALGLYFYLTEK